MTTKIGIAGSEITTVDPEARAYEVSDTLATSRRAIDGTLRTQYSTRKEGWPGLRFHVTETQRDALLTELRRLQHLSWLPPEGGSFTVAVERHSWMVEGPARYVVQASLMEV